MPSRSFRFVAHQRNMYNGDSNWLIIPLGRKISGFLFLYSSNHFPLPRGEVCMYTFGVIPNMQALKYLLLWISFQLWKFCYLIWISNGFPPFTPCPKVELKVFKDLICFFSPLESYSTAYTMLLIYILLVGYGNLSYRKRSKTFLKREIRLKHLFNKQCV